MSLQAPRPDLDSASPGARAQQESKTVRTRIGVLINDTQGSFQTPIVQALLEEAAVQDVQLLFFPGRLLTAEVWPNQQFNAVYAVASQARLSGILSLTNTFSARLTDAQTHEFLRRFSCPLVNFGFDSPGIPSVCLSNTAGFTDLLEHLIQVHGYRRLAFMQGPEHNVDADERFAAYSAALASAGLSRDPQLIVRGEFNQFDGRKAMETLLDRGVAFDALIAANDEMALAALAVAGERGLRVPEDFAITGFDDVFSIHKDGPPLTTVHVPVVEQAVTGFHLLLGRIAGNRHAERCLVRTRAVFRQTCGCPGPGMRRDGGMGRPGEPRQRAEPAALVSARGHPTRLSRALTQALGQDRADAFESALRIAIDGSLSAGEDLSELQRLLLALNQECFAKPGLAHQELLRGTELLQRGQIAITNALAQTRAQKDLQRRFNEQIQNGVMRLSSAAFDRETMLRQLCSDLKQIGMASCLIGLFEEPEPFDTLEGFTAPARLRLIYAQAQFDRLNEIEGQLIDMTELLPCLPGPRASAGLTEAPAAVVSATRGHIPWIVMPIFHHNQQFGLIFLDAASNARLSFEQVRHEVSSALTGAILVTELARARDVLRQDLNTASERNQALQVLAERDELTGLLNRRGFHARAQSVIDARRAGSALLLFADLDHLKRINDEFGHAAGDQAIAAAGGILQASFREIDLVARLGGDEFVILSADCSAGDIERIRARVDEAFSAHNEKNALPYRLACSLGFCIVDLPSAEPMSHLLNRADQYLYEEKRLRKAKR
jgi:diguanylate cyclase (GGDEF)-like protein